jgi:sugar transferase (PEP-CTERM system associated)
MIKILNRYFPGRLFVLLITENLLILVGLWVALAFRMGNLRVPVSDYTIVVSKALIVTFICQICFFYADLYDLRTITSKLHIVVRLLYGLGAASLIISVLLYVVPDIGFEKGIIEASIVASIFLILSWRMLLEWLNRAYTPGERVLLVGSGNTAHNLALEVRQRRDLPIKLVGAVSEQPDGESVAGLECLGSLDKLQEIIERSSPNRLVIALKERRQQLPIDVLLRFRLRGLLIEDASTLYEKLTGRIPVESIRPSELIFSDGFRQSIMRRTYARIFGFAGALLGLLVCGPLMLLVALVIKLESRGPVFYKQTRVGKHGRNFEILKFRSMRSDAEAATGPKWATENDPRITRVGRWLRMLRIDELPQFINILRGEMSFVGPRPERPYFVELLKQQIPLFDLRHSIRPGVTGWAQVSYPYGASIEDAKQKLEYDLFYVKNGCPSLDTLVLFQTVKTVLFGKGAR